MLSAETRAAWERFEALRNRDLDALKADEALRRRLHEGPRELVNDVPSPKKAKPAPEPEPNPKWRSLKDEGWD